MDKKTREKKIYKVTVLGSVVNIVLVVLKFVFGILGHSAAMIADAVHSLSDLITDIVVLLFVKLSNKPQDSDHDYGHGKYETLATSLQARTGSITDSGGKYKERLLVYKGEDMISLSVRDIFYICKNEGCTTVTASTGNTYKLSSTIQEMEEQLNPNAFFRLNRKYLINIKALKKVSPFFNSKLIVQLYHCQDEHIIVSKEKSSRLKEWLNL